MASRETAAWVLDELPRLNQAILSGEARSDVLTEALANVVLPGLPSPARLTPASAQQLLVHLGFMGASVARHFQERTPGGKQMPERAFEGLAVGAEQIPFRRYFAAVADRTGTGHDQRDSYASLVRWNVGTVRVRLDGHILAVLPGVFDDGRVRTYTGTSGEERFFALVKKGEAIELAVNNVLEPLSSSHTKWEDPDVVRHVRAAAVLLSALRQLFLDFAALSPQDGMPAEHFLDVFRQFAVHWSPGDIPPSGALDAEALKRDFLLGIAIPDYNRHVRRLFPGLLADEKAVLERLMGQPTLPRRVAVSLGVDLAELRDADPAQLQRMVARHPVLVDWCRLLTAHAQAAGAHLMLSKKFLFKPQGERDSVGVGDQALVSNRAGTTGMTETYLERLTRARRDHELAPLRRFVGADMPEKDGLGGVTSTRRMTSPVEVCLTS